jgi:hypothetical protein
VLEGILFQIWGIIIYMPSDSGKKKKGTRKERGGCLRDERKEKRIIPNCHTCPAIRARKKRERKKNGEIAYETRGRKSEQSPTVTLLSGVA